MIEHMTQHQRCAVFAAMGSGKTGGTFKALDTVELIDGPRPSIVFAPKLVAESTWPNEADKWDFMAGKTVVPIAGSAEQRKRALRSAVGKDIIATCSYDNAPWLVDQVGAEWPWRNLVADELTKLKSMRLGTGNNAGGQRAKSLARVAFSRVDRFVGLTGTPAPNGLKDMWGQLWFVDKGERLGRTHTGFMERWFKTNPYTRAVDPLPFAQEQIQDAIRDVCLTIDPRDYISIDDPIVTRVEVDIPAKARMHYREMEKEMFTQIALQGAGSVVADIEAVNAGSRVMKCLQIGQGFLFTNPEATAYEELHNAKLDALEQIVDEANGMPVVVAYHFKPDLVRLKKRFPYGKTKDDLGKNVEREWNSGKHKLLFAHPASLGHGLNLQDAGNILAFYGLWWDLEQHQQIIERIGPLRQFQAGHPRAVFLYYILAKGTLDEAVFNRLMSKRSVQDILLDAMKEKIS